MSQVYATKKKSAVPANEGKAAENISKSDMLRMSGAGAPQPMSPALREKFEPGFGADFSNIRISRGRIPEEMGVQAVAKGTDILIDSRAGMDVLGHELAHVVQQAQGQVQGGFPVVHDAALEHQADVMGARAASGMSAVEGGMSGFSGGEMMSIAPMSDASAPAQCKSKKDKSKEQAPAKTRGDLFREDYGSRDVAGQVELLSNMARFLTSTNDVDESERDAYDEILKNAPKEIMDELWSARGKAAYNLNAAKQRALDMGNDEDTATAMAKFSSEADDYQSYGSLANDIGGAQFGGLTGSKTYGHLMELSSIAQRENTSINQAMQAADSGVFKSTNKWSLENADMAKDLALQTEERRAQFAKQWNDSRNARLAPKEPEKKKHRFRRWMNK